MRYDTRRIAFERTGEGEAVLLIHGNPATHTLWRPVIERVSDARTIYAIDLPGFGGSPRPDDDREYAIDELARILLGFADNHGIDRFDCVGHSFGGGVALTIGAMAPERVRTLAAITPLTARMPPLGRLTRIPPLTAMVSAAWRLAPHRLRRWAARNWTHVSYGKGYSPERAAEVAREADRPDIFLPLTGLMRSIDREVYRGHLDALSRGRIPPILLVGAGRDRVIPHTQFLELAGRIPRARVVDIDDSGHVPMWQHPEMITGLLREFWEQGPASAPPM